MKIPLMIDSGAYSAYTQKGEVNLDEYIKFIHQLHKRYSDFVYVGLDVIGDAQGSFDNYMTMREAGLDPMPVYHACTDSSWLLKYMEHTKHIAIGAIANISSSRRVIALDRLWNDHLIDKNRMPLVKIHGMGITSFPLMKRYPWHSIDSTSWMQAGMYGKIFLPKRKNGNWDFTDKPYVLAFSSKSPSVQEKGAHIDSVNELERRTLMDYLAYTGMEYGEGEGEEMTVEGVTNSWAPRCFLNAFFFSKFIETLPYPRPFTIQKKRTLI